MKNIIITLSLVVIATMSHAASINWTMSGSTTTVLYAPKTDGKNSTSPLSNATLYLMLGSSENLTKLSEATTSTIESVLGNLALNKNYSTSSTGTRPTISGVVVSDDSLSAGTLTTFALVVLGSDSDGGKWYKYITPTGTPYADGTAVADQTKLTTAWAQMTSTAATAAQWNAVTPVPEPSTAVLALAGLALLLKRRKA